MRPQSQTTRMSPESRFDMLPPIKGLEFNADIHKYKYDGKWLHLSPTQILSIDLDDEAKQRIEETRDGEGTICGATVVESQEPGIVPNRCGHLVASPCLVPGGCRERRAWWSLQHQQSGGRRTFQCLHDPAWTSQRAVEDLSQEGTSQRAPFRLLRMLQIVKVLPKTFNWMMSSRKRSALKAWTTLRNGLPNGLNPNTNNIRAAM